MDNVTDARRMFVGQLVTMNRQDHDDITGRCVAIEENGDGVDVILEDRFRRSLIIEEISSGEMSGPVEDDEAFIRTVKIVNQNTTGAFIQHMGIRTVPVLSTVEYLKIRTPEMSPLSWRQIWNCFNESYPGRWAFEVFPPASELVDDANIYHLFMTEVDSEAEEAINGLSINRR